MSEAADIATDPRLEAQIARLLERALAQLAMDTHFELQSDMDILPSCGLEREYGITCIIPIHTKPLSSVAITITLKPCENGSGDDNG